MKNILNGVVKDTRPLEKKAKDFIHEAGSVPIIWKELDLTKLNLTSQRFQNGSYSCIFQTGASMLEKLTGKVISATPYFWRINYPNEGACFWDMANIFYNRFTTTETLSTSQNQTEVQMNQLKQLTTFLGITGYKQPAVKDIDQIAEAVEAYGQCGVSYETNMLEYSTNPPKYLGAKLYDDNGIALNGTFGHAICCLAYGLVNGVKTLVCRDSATPSGITYIIENFHKNRNIGALYFLGSKDVSVPQDEQKMSALKQLIQILLILLSKISK